MSFNYIFPYHLFKRGDKVVIYGAGLVGTDFYLQAVSESYVNIVDIVDKMYADMKYAEIPVNNINRLLNNDYDYILIAVEAESVANSIKQSIINMGIDSKCIKWDGSNYYYFNYINNVLFSLLGENNENKNGLSVINNLGRKFKWYYDNNANDEVSYWAKMEHNILPKSLLVLGKKTGGIFLDIGANIGGVSLALASMGWKGYAIEAASSNCDLLNRSIKENKFDIKVCNKAIWRKNGKIYFISKGPYGQIRESNVEGAEEIEAVTLNTFSESFIDNNIKIDFIKMDIEGSEVAALDGAELFLEKNNYPPIFVEACPANLGSVDKKSTIDLIKKADQLGYNVYCIEDKMWKRLAIDHFPDVMVTDYLLLNRNNNNCGFVVTDVLYQSKNNDDIKIFILKTLNELRNDCEGLYSVSWAISSIFALKHYNELLHDDDIVSSFKSLKLNEKYAYVADLFDEIFYL